MIKEWNDLPKHAQEYINQRFSHYDIQGAEAYQNSDLFPNNIKELDEDDIIEILKSKDISHKLPTSVFPEKESDISNIIVEDRDIKDR